MAKNTNLNKANKAKQDEFYTQIADIERELSHYKEHFCGKTIFCNCDDPETSNFWQYFQLNFYQFKLKKLIATHYEETKQSYKLEMITRETNWGGQIRTPEIKKTPLHQNGDFRSPECVEILKEADIVVTNPPFSLFREYVAQLMEYEKKFIIIGNKGAITYKEIFPLIQNNKIWLGYGFNGGNAYFAVPKNDRIEEYADGVYNAETGLVKFRNCGWFTNVDYDQRHEKMLLYKNYTPEEYPQYDDYDAIEVKKTAEIPCDYDGKMGVPITFMDKYSPEQFEILGLDRYMSDNPHYGRRFRLNGKETYARIIIRRRMTDEN